MSEALIAQIRHNHNSLLQYRTKKRNHLRDRLSDVFQTDPVYEAILYQQIVEANEGIQEIRDMIDRTETILEKLEK